MSKIKDHLGLKIGRGVEKRFIIIECVISNNGKNNGGTWIAQCICGNKITATAYSFQHKNSCGCISQKERLKDGLKRRKPLEVTLNTEYRNHKGDCTKSDRIPLPKELWKEIVRQKCAYCGTIDKRNIARKKSYQGYKGKTLTPEIIQSYEILCNGVDRIDSSRGYDPDNCAPCCRHCNTIKMQYTVEQFLAKVEAIYNYRIKGRGTNERV